MAEAMSELETVGDEGAVCWECGRPIGGQLAELMVTADGRVGRRHVFDPMASAEQRARQLLEVYARGEKFVTAAMSAGTDTDDVYDAHHDLWDELTDHLADALVALLAEAPGPQPLPTRLPRRCSAGHSWS